MRPGTLLLVLVLLASLLALQAPNAGQVPQADMKPKGTLLVQPAAQAPMIRNFTIFVGATGFNSTGLAGITLTVVEGDRVTIRFVYNDTNLSYNNPHEVLIEAYGLSSGTIDRITHERTVTFTANIPGRTSFRCIVTDCDGHSSLLAGVLDVQPYSGPKIPTSLSLAARASQLNVTVHIQVIDVLESPVAGILVHFYRYSTWGFAEIGVQATNSSGEAHLVYAPPSRGEVTLKAEFLGSGLYSSSTSPPLTIDFSGAPDSGDGFPYVWGQNVLVDIRMVGVPALTGLMWIGLIFLIVGSVWATYLYVGRQLLGIWEEGADQASSYGEQDTGTQRIISSPSAIVTGLGMIALGYADVLILTFLLPTLSLTIFPVLAFIEGLLVTSLLSFKR